MKLIQSAGILALILTMTACSREPVLKGERLDLRTPLTRSDEAATSETEDGVAPAVNALGTDGNIALPITLPAAVNHSEWTHRNGTATHRIIHPALGQELSRVWSSNIGAGDSRRFRITADPVASAGRIFTMDSQSSVRAHTTDGALLWSRDLTPGSDRTSDASGGGLAVSGDIVFATTGFGTLNALDAASGQMRWTQRLNAPATGAPTVLGDLVYVVSRDGRAWAVNIADGRVRWELPGVPTQSVMVGGAGPAVNDKVAVFPFGSGDLVAGFPRAGVRLWGARVAGQRRGRVYATVNDVSGDPVIDGDVVYTGNSSGSVIALNARSGERIWTATEGTYSPVWPSGGSVFLVSDQAELIRLDAETGTRIWAVELPYYTTRRERRRKGVYAHYGPILAGNRLIVASSDGQIRSYNPVDGSLLSSVGLPGGATTNPIVVNGTLYVVSSSGTLHAFR